MSLKTGDWKMKDRGLNYLEPHVWIEASRSFHQALRLDPNLRLLRGALFSHDEEQL
jgi:hypothetical protein